MYATSAATVTVFSLATAAILTLGPVFSARDVPDLDLTKSRFEERAAYERVKGTYSYDILYSPEKLNAEEIAIEKKDKQHVSTVPFDVPIYCATDITIEFQGEGNYFVWIESPYGEHIKSGHNVDTMVIPKELIRKKEFGEYRIKGDGVNASVSFERTVSRVISVKDRKLEIQNHQKLPHQIEWR